MIEKLELTADQLRVNLHRVKWEIFNLSNKLENHASLAIREEINGREGGSTHEVAVYHRDLLYRRIQELRIVVVDLQSCLSTCETS
jgi:hypothetical protein